MIRIFTRLKNGLNVVHINAQSLKIKIDEFRYIFESSNVHVICVSETWFDAKVKDGCYSLHGYRIFRADRNSNGGGIAIYVRNNIRCKVVKKTKKDDKVEYLFLELYNGNERLLLGNVYRPNRYIETESFFSKLSSITVGYTNILIAGDFNSNILVESKFSDEMKCIGLDPVNTTNPTHFSRYASTLLDIFFTNSIWKILMFEQISAPVFSKHDLIFTTLDFLSTSTEKKYSYRDFGNINYDSLSEKLIQIPWDSTFYMPAVDEQLQFIQGNIIQLYDEFVPIKTRTKRVATTADKWFSPEIKRLIELRNMAYTRWKRFRTSALLSAFRTLRNKVNTNIRIAKSSYYKDRFSNCLDSKSRWREIRAIGVVGDTFDYHTAAEDVDIDAINRKFVDLPVPVANVNPYVNYPMGDTSTIFNFNCVTQSEVYESFLSIKSNAISYDGVHPKFIKIIFPTILPYITNLFCTIITKSSYPAIWKHAKIVPIPKTDNEFRPIAILPFLSKIFERIMHNQLSIFLNNNNLLTSRQSGFRPFHSCVSALIDVTEDIRSQIDNGEVAFLILLDHSKAFDTVNTDILISKLKNFLNFSSTATKLVASYLNQRSQSVFYGGKISSSIVLTRGVPQGSILGPLLYSIYANDLPTQLEYCNVQMYADDVQLYISCKTSEIDDCVRKINRDLRNVHDWATSNGLCLNPSKSKCLLVTKRTMTLPLVPDLILGGSRIVRVTSTKNLGVILNDKLEWSDHVNVATAKVYGMLRNLWSTQSFIPIEIRMLLAKTYLVPTLLYGCELFTNCDSTSMRKLRVAFNSITRYIYGLRRFDSISHYAKQVFGVSFEFLLQCRSLIYLHKIIYTRQPKYLYDRLIFLRSNRGNRIKQQRYRTELSKQHFYINTIRIWNQLPLHLQRIENATQFKKYIFEYFQRK